ncbi:MAG: lipopolysaccharide transport system permease protein [Solirubrobacteraceae bacterium]|jgi:lipopolysaccharide transport system permease protein|nr:lipopolysaccharide transport system permease protein [Solirubrobacteraceae bacterium]
MATVTGPPNPTTSAPQGPVTIIEPVGGLMFPDLRELWRRRDLLRLFVRRDIAVRYKQSIAGGLWAVLQPVGLAAVFSVFLGLLAKVPSQTGIPYPVFALSGMVAWLFFTNCLSRSSDSTVASSDLISKVYFPRFAIPLAAALAPILDFAVAFVVVVGALLVYGEPIGPRILLIPLIVPLMLALALGAGLWLSALYVRFRDIGLVVPFVIQVGLFITPIIYPFSLLPDNLRLVYGLNPLVGVLELYRWMLFPSAAWPGLVVLVPVIVAPLVLVTGAAFFERSQRGFADVI